MLIAICNIWMFQPIVSTLHELGHALPALLLTRKSKGQGREGKKFLFFFSPYKLGKRFSIKISLKKTPGLDIRNLNSKKKVPSSLFCSGVPRLPFANLASG